MFRLQPEVRYHEPWLALEGGSGLGLGALLPICTGAAYTGRLMALETNGGKQVHDVVGILRGIRRGGGSAGGAPSDVFENVQVRVDYNGVERFVTAWKAF